MNTNIHEDFQIYIIIPLKRTYINAAKEIRKIIMTYLYAIGDLRLKCIRYQTRDSLYFSWV